jgi:thiol:disulfide interchange protein DsbD
MIHRLIILLLIVGCGKQASEDNKNGIKWGNNLDLAFAIASNSNKLIMIDFMAEWCPPCKEMDKITFSNTNIIKKSNEFIPVRIDVDKQKNIAEEYNGNARKYGGIGIPNILFLDKEKKIIRHIVGFHDVNQLMGIMDSVLMKL